MTSASPRRLAYAQFGPYARLYSLDHFLEQLQDLGFTRRSLRRFLRAISVPILHVGDIELVDHLSLGLALRAILRVGQPDFYTSSSKSVRKGRRPASTLSADTFSTLLGPVLFELMASRKIAGAFAPLGTAELKDAAREAIARMVAAGTHLAPAAAQEAYASAALTAYRSRNPAAAEIPCQPFPHQSNLPTATETPAPSSPSRRPKKPRSSPSSTSGAPGSP